VKGVTSEVIAEVRSRANLLEVISEFVVLKRAGKEHRGLCPFHSEKTPSFHVNPEKGIYKCFGCGEGGDAFAFVQKVKRLDFIDAVKDLAHRYGVKLVESLEDREEYNRRTGILMLYQQAAEYYARLLADPREGGPAREYLKARGLPEEIVARFKLGYAPQSWDGLVRYLTSVNKVSPETLEEAGLARRRPDSNTYFDLFRHRLMIPICDDQGRVIAFGGRTLADDQIKYLNSPETCLYTKGQHLFALNLAREAIKEQDGVIVVEGYFDAITAHQFGFRQTVATLGTALTDRQARLLVRYSESKRVYLSFDADPAGERAMERGVETLNQIAEGIGIELRALRVTAGKDPDECLRSTAAHGGPEAFAQAIASAPLLIDYQLEKTVASINMGTHTGRIEAARQLVPLLAQIKNSVGRGEYVRQWALRLGVREEELLSDVGQFRRQQGLGLKPLAKPDTRARPAGEKRLQSGFVEAERQLLALFLSSRDDYQLASDLLADESFIEPVHQRIKEALEGIGSQFRTVEDLQARLLDRLGPDAEAARVAVELILKAEETRKQKAPAEVILKEGRARILQERLNREKSRLRTLLGSATSEDEQIALQSTINKLRQVENKLLPNATTEEELSEVKRNIEEILNVSNQAQRLETTA